MIGSKFQGHYLVDSLVYGPVVSRRYGRTIGINLLPMGKKLCSFNCIYCQLGWGNQKDLSQENVFPSVKEVENELREKLLSIEIEEEKINIVLSGNGEPTLHPQFPQIVDVLLNVKKEQGQNIPVICFTNGSKLKDKKILEALSRLDECCVKLDANSKKINLPQSTYHFQDLIPFINQLSNLVIQSCFVEGEQSNCGPQEVREWIDTIKNLSCKRVDLYTISRKTPHPRLSPVSQQILSKIKDELAEVIACPITVSVS